MTKFLLFILALGSLIFFQWRMNKAQKMLEGQPTPEAIKDGIQHPDGIIYYFYHPDCGPCQQMTIIVDHVKHKHPGRIEKINVANNPELTIAMGIKSTPTTVLVVNNKITRAFIGYISTYALEDVLKPDQ